MSALSRLLPARAFGLALLLLPLGPQAAEPVTLERIVAVVNKSVITEGELAARVATVSRNLARQGVQLPPADTLRQQVLERLISERVLIDYAADTGIRIDDAQLDRAIDRIAEQNKLTLPQFKAALEKEGVSLASFREDIRNDMMISRLREREVDSRVYVSETEVDQLLASQKDQAKAETEYRLSHILVAVPEGASAEQTAARQRRAEAALQEIKAGKAFAQVAATYSDAPDALSGGDLGWRGAGRLPPDILAAVDALQPGGVTPIIRSAVGFHILKLMEKRVDDGKVIVDQSRIRHILVKVNEVMADADARAKILEIRDRIQQGAKFEEQARLYGEDGTAPKGGELGWVSPGDPIDPDFMAAANALKVNELSQPVRTPFGWHLIEVMERRKQDVTVERQRVKAQMQLRERKADEQYEDWVRQLRDRAFVENRLDDK
jgi:peptidyl-prolyl cis-trans isomerase SurA